MYVNLLTSNETPPPLYKRGMGLVTEIPGLFTNSSQTWANKHLTADSNALLKLDCGDFLISVNYILDFCSVTLTFEISEFGRNKNTFLVPCYFSHLKLLCTRSICLEN